MNKKQIKIKEIIENINIPIIFKPTKYDYIDNAIPQIQTYTNFIIKDCKINNFKKNSNIRNFMESISRKYNIDENNLELFLINNPEWYDNFKVYKIN
jgi:hypothetical protein